MLSLSKDLGLFLLTFNEKFFKDELDLQDFVFLYDEKYRGYFRLSDKIIHFGGNLCQLSKENIFTRILHEMIHIYQFQIDRLSPKVYHNLDFCTQALRLGLYVTKRGKGTNGWSVTLLEPPRHSVSYLIQEPLPPQLALRKHIFNSLDFSEEGRRELIRIKHVFKPRVTQSLSTLKYECSCPAPHNSIRSGRRPDGRFPLDVFCRRCGKPFTCVDQHAQVS